MIAVWPEVTCAIAFWLVISPVTSRRFACARGKSRGFADEGGDRIPACERLPHDFTAGLPGRAKDQQLHPVARAPGGTVTTAAASASTSTTTAST